MGSSRAALRAGYTPKKIPTLAETINPASPAALRHFFADLTHAQPLVPETLELLAQQAGFARTEIRYLNAPPQHADVRLNEQLFAPLDYALIGVA